MEETERIRGFLRAVRRRALMAAVLRDGSLTAAVALAVLLLLAFCAVRVDPAAFWPTLTGVVLLLVTGVGLALGWLPLRRLRTESAVARYVGRHRPQVASDLLSAVELAVPAGQPLPHGGSESFARAFAGVVAEAVRPLEPRALVPMAPAWRGGAAMA